MEVLVLGSSGFIGKHLVAHFRESDIEVLKFDRVISNPRDSLPTFVGDIKDRDAVFDAVSRCDRWVNLAGLLGTAEIVENPLAAIVVNITGALNVFDAARLYKKPGLQIAVGNYWMNNPYSITKDTTSRFAQMYNKEHDTDIRIVRAMNVFGPGQKHKPIRKIFPNVVIPALLNKPITIYGDGTQVMDLIYVKDVCEILSRALLLEGLPKNLILQAGVGGGMTINQLVNDVLRITNSKSKVVRVPMRPGEEENSVVEISLEGWLDLHHHLKFFKSDLTKHKVALTESICWYRDNLGTFEWAK